VFPEGASVPKIIHQVFFPGVELPAILEENVRRIKTLNPTWEHRLYDEPDMVDFIGSTYGKRVLDYFHRINEKYGAARADLFRYLLLYKCGGVYIDIKSSLERPLDDVLRSEDVYLLSRWKGRQFEGWGTHSHLKDVGGEEFQQWHIIAASGHPFLRVVIERVLDNFDLYNPILHDTGRKGVMWATGPIAYTLAIAPLLDRHRYRLVDGQDELGLKYSVFGTESARAHKAVFKYHYTDLNEPVIYLTGMRRILWLMFGPIQNHIIQRVRNIFDALARRLPYRRVLRR
jgi:mannosyltransferase OCH1-like enzyme